jgi:hypothetical protein
MDLLSFSGPPLWEHFQGLDPEALGGVVSWAGTEPAPHRLGVAREYTERWIHHQQIRDALNVGGLREARWIRPLLETFAYSLPVALRAVPADDGTIVELTAVGQGGGRWSVLRRNNAWSVIEESRTPPAASLALDVETLWRLYTKGIDRATARSRATIEGDQALALPLLSAVAIIA